MKALEYGLMGYAETMVVESNLARTMKSGSLDVFATPAMCALMEEAACNCICDSLDCSQSSVGTVLNVCHDRATAVGRKIKASAKLVKVDGHKLIFEVSAEDMYGPIGWGTHERFIIDIERFMNRLR
ncbi:MAG: dihydrolipoamide acyltransferase [Phascolarctobacterium sp.]|nr:dihydrolipoamide acyltransferase [Phascolarctobacterium sp.]